jgi:WD40 repeat protein
MRHHSRFVAIQHSHMVVLCATAIGLLSDATVRAQAFVKPPLVPGKTDTTYVAEMDTPSDIALAFSAAGDRLLTAGGQEARVWDATTFNAVTPPLDHGSPLVAARFDGQGRYVLTVGREYARVWDARTGKAASPRLRHGKDLLIQRAAISPDGTRVLTVAAEPEEKKPGIRYLGVNVPPPEVPEDQRSVRVWDRVTGELAQSLEHHTYVRYAGFSPDGKRILTMSTYLTGTACLWDAGTGKQVGATIGEALGGGAAFSRDGARFAVTGWYQVEVRSTADGTKVAIINDFDNHNLPERVVLTPDGGAVLVTDQSFPLRAWAVPSAKPIGTPPETYKDGILDGENEVVFSPDGKTFFLSGYDHAGAGLHVAPLGKRLWSPPEHFGRIRGVRFAADGSIWFGQGGRESAKIYKLVP